jgi:hypothetical protein
MTTTYAIPPHITELAHEAFSIDKDNSISLKSWLKDNEKDIADILAQAKVILKERKPNLSAEEIDYAITVLRDPLVHELAATHPTQKMLTQSREEAFANFKVRKLARANLNKMSIDTLLLYVFSERANVLSDSLRSLAQKKQQRNEQIEAIGKLKTLMAGCQPVQGEPVKAIVVAESHEEIIKLKLTALEAEFDLTPYINRDLNKASLDKNHEFALPFAAYQQLNTALTTHTEKCTADATSEQLQIVELNKKINQVWEFLSNFNKRHHDTLQTIISNMR